MQPNKFHIGYRVNVRFPEGKLRSCEVENILYERYVILRPLNTTKTFVLSAAHQILEVWDLSGKLVQAVA